MYLVREDVEFLCEIIIIIATAMVFTGFIWFCITDSDASCYTTIAASVVVFAALGIRWRSKIGL